MPLQGKKWTPQQRAKFMATVKAKSKQAKTKVKAKGKKHATGTEVETISIEEAHVIYLHGEVRGRIASFAASVELPERYLARRVGALLLGGKGR